MSPNACSKLISKMPLARVIKTTFVFLKFWICLTTPVGYELTNDLPVC